MDECVMLKQQKPTHLTLLQHLLAVQAHNLPFVQLWPVNFCERIQFRYWFERLQRVRELWVCASTINRSCKRVKWDAGQWKLGEWTQGKNAASSPNSSNSSSNGCPGNNLNITKPIENSIADWDASENEKTVVCFSHTSAEAAAYTRYCFHSSN